MERTSSCLTPSSLRPPDSVQDPADGNTSAAAVRGERDDNEAARLQALAKLCVLDSPDEPAVDDLVEVAAALCEVPIALVSLVDATRQWFKARFGLDATETPRDIAFCARAIEADDPFIVPDAAIDIRFAANPLVVGAPHIRFYAGIPLVSHEGHRYGTLCVIDTRPRTLTPRQIDALKRLARQVLSLLERHLRAQQAERNEVMLASAFEAMPDAIITCGTDGRIGDCNRLARTWHSLDENNDQTPLATSREPLQRALLGESVRDAEIVIRAAGQPPRTVLCNASPLAAPDGVRLGAVAIMRDVTELRASTAALADERRRLAMIIDGTNAGTWEWNVQTGETRFNERWAEIVGYTLEELEPTSIDTWARLAHPDDLAESNGLLQEHFAGQRPRYDTVCRMRHKDGRWVWVHDRGRVFEWDAQGRPLWMAGSHLDVTAEREATIELANTRQRLQEIVHGSQDVAVIASDQSGVITIFNPGAEGLLGYRAEDMIGRATPQAFHLASEVQAYGQELTKRLGTEITGFAVLVEEARERTHTRQWTYVCNDGSFRQVRLSISALHDSRGVLTGYVGIAVDITALLEAKERLSEAEARVRTTLEAVGEAIITTDHRGLVTYVNPVAVLLLGATASAEVVGHPLDQVIVLETESAPECPLSLLTLASAETDDSGLPSELVVFANGRRTPVAVTKTRLTHADAGRAGAVIILRNSTEDRARASEAVRLARIDPLTGLANRRELEGQLATAVGLDRDSSLVLIDLDGFKAINDKHGHLAGDEVLKAIATALREPVRANDVVARLGGDEFAMLLLSCPLPRAQTIAEAVRVAIDELVVAWNGHSLRVGASLGLSPLRRGASIAAALAAADAACYAAKAQGKNRICLLPEPASAPIEAEES